MQAVGPDEARVKLATGPMGRIRLHDYIGTSVSTSRGPQAFIVEMLEPNARLEPHFHDVDQFQVTVAGTGRLGRHDLHPVTVHYADAYSPYGPILAGDAGLSYMTLRLNAAGGFWPMPGSRDKMKTRAGRQFTLAFRPEADAAHATGEAEALGERFEDGLAVQRLRLAPGQAGAIPAEPGCGGYVLVCAGSARVGGADCAASAVLLFERGETRPEAVAGPDGADLLVLVFPRPSDRAGSHPSTESDYVPPPGLAGRA